MNLLNMGVLTLVTVITWWLTGKDRAANGESKQGRYWTRGLRTVAVALLFVGLLWLAEGNCGYGGVPLLLIIPVSIALILRSSVAELCTHGVLRLIDPTLNDQRPFDAGKNLRYLNTVAHLLKNGRRHEALRLSEEFKRSGEVDVVALENLLEFHGVRTERVKISTPLAEAARLRTEGKIAEAEKLLESLLAKNPADSEAALQLMRLCAEDLRQPYRAHELLRALAKQPHADRNLIEFARRSIDDWSRPKSETKATIAPSRVQSVAELLAQGAYGTAIERLEEEISLWPQNLELRVKLAEVHAVHCGNLVRAEKIIRQIELDPDASPSLVAVARMKLQEWRTT